MGTPLSNFKYCTKGNRYEVIGDFTAEKLAASKKDNRRATLNVNIIKGLLTDKSALQIMVTKEYAKYHVYYDKVVRKIKQTRKLHEVYQEWCQKKLRLWQYNVFKRVLQQDQRRVTWVFDFIGNSGKSFLSNIMTILYNFQLLDGQINTRDLPNLLNVDAAGICLDVCRAAEGTFDYAVVETLKNGYSITGKYSGKCFRFTPMKVVVFANFLPQVNALSQDRWDILTVGEGVLADMTQDSIVDPSTEYPYVPPPADCDLSEDFDLEQFLVDQLP